LDELNERIRVIDRAKDALAAYTVRRENYVQSQKSAFAAQTALERTKKLPNNETLNASIDDGVEKMAQLDAGALGLIVTHNDLVRELHHYCLQHNLPVPSDYKEIAGD